MNSEVPATADIRMYDVYDIEVFDWIRMSKTSDQFPHFEYSEQGISTSQDDQENIMWVEIRIIVPYSGIPPEEVHLMVAEDLYSIDVYLTYHKPNYG